MKLKTQVYIKLSFLIQTKKIKIEIKKKLRVCNLY